MTLVRVLTSGQADGTPATNTNTGGALTTSAGTIVWKSSMGAHGSSGLQFTTTATTGTVADRYTLAAQSNQMQATAKLTMPPSAPGGEYQLIAFRYTTGTGGRCFWISWETTGEVRALDSANIVTILAAAGTLSLGTQYVFAVSATGASTSAGSATIHVYAVGGSTPLASATMSGKNFTANNFGAIDLGGGVAIGSHGAVDLQYNDGAGSEIPDYVPTTPLATPVVTLGAKTAPTTPGGSDGTQQVSWAAVSSAGSYDALIATKSSPAQSDFTSVHVGVTSPYTFTGLSDGTYAVGVEAQP